MALVVVLAQRVPYPPNKGEKLRTFHQIEGLIDKGHHVQVIVPVEDDQEKQNALALAKHFDIEVSCHPLPHKLHRLARAVVTNKSFSEANFYSKTLMLSLENALQKADALLLTASSLAPYVFALPNALKSKLKLLMDFMDVDSDKWLQYAQQSNFPKSLVYRREAQKISSLERATAKYFDTCFLIAQAEINIFKQNVSSIGQVEVLGNGIDQSLFNPNLKKPAAPMTFLFSGVMDYKPNIDAVMWFVKHCWPSIKQDLGDVKFVIAGMNPVAEISKLSADSTIEVTGFVDDIKPYFDKAHIFVAPFQIARGVQNKVLQAMACALPVISTTLGAEGINCQPETDIVLADDAKSFLSAAISLASNQTRRENIGQAALITIEENYAWQSVLKPLMHGLEMNNLDKS